jgi:hypothetical protein
MEMLVIRVFVKNVKKHVEHIAEHVLSAACRKTPFSVPVGVGYKMALYLVVIFVIHNYLLIL